MKFIVTIEEMVSDNFEIEAETAEDAIRIAEDKYHSREFALEPGNLVCKQMSIVSPNNELTEWIEF